MLGISFLIFVLILERPTFKSRKIKTYIWQRPSNDNISKCPNGSFLRSSSLLRQRGQPSTSKLFLGHHHVVMVSKMNWNSLFLPMLHTFYEFLVPFATNGNYSALELISRKFLPQIFFLKVWLWLDIISLNLIQILGN